MGSCAYGRWSTIGAVWRSEESTNGESPTRRRRDNSEELAITYTPPQVRVEVVVKQVQVRTASGGRIVVNELGLQAVGTEIGGESIHTVKASRKHYQYATRSTRRGASAHDAVELGAE